MPAENITVIGFMGEGKGTVATELVKCCDFRLVDLDDDIERRAGMSVQENCSGNSE